MLIHYLSLAWDQLKKYRLQSVVSIVSLAIGFVCFALATMWIKYETTYDAFHKDADRIYYLNQIVSPGTFITDKIEQFPEVEEVDVVINPADLEIETCKSSGAGGQHINKTESAIRIIHKPSGIVVECQEERSQFKNKDKAMKLLRAKLYDIEKTKRDAEIADERRRQVGTGDRSERIRTYNFPQGRVTDHRIGLTLYTLDTFMNGKIEAVVNALVSADTAEKLSNMNQHE